MSPGKSLKLPYLDKTIKGRCEQDGIALSTNKSSFIVKLGVKELASPSGRQNNEAFNLCEMYRSPMKSRMEMK